MYTALSPVYDLFYDDDSVRRAEYYAGFLPERGEGVDIGCGTGKFTLELYRKGYRVYGADGSESMLSQATENALASGADVKFVVGDAEKLRTAHELDFATAALDVINYVKNMSKAFAAVYKSLAKGGVFAFDISSEYKLRKVLAGNTFSETKNGYTYIWQNFASGKKLIIDFTVFSPHGDSYIKSCETQVQYIRSDTEVASALAAAGFRKVRTYGFYTHSKPRAQSDRIMFVATK